MSGARRHRCCGEFTRSELARRSLAEAGNGLPSIERGDARAGRHRPLRGARSCSAAARLALSVYGASLLSPRAFVEGIAEGRREPGQGARLRLPRGRHRRALGALAGRRRQLPAAAADAAAGARRRTDVDRGPAPAVASRRRRRSTSSTARARSRSSRGSATRTPTSPTSPRATTGRSASSASTRTPAGSGACSTPSAATTTRCRASRSTARCRRASRPRGSRWRRPGAPSYDLWAPGVWGDVEDLMFESFARLGDAAEKSARRAAQRRRPGRPAGEHPARASCAAFSDEITEPGPLPRHRALLREPRRPRGDARRRAADHGRLGRRAGQLRHPRRAGRGLRQRPQARPATTLLAFQRDLEARGLDDRVVTLVWSEFGRRPEENGSAPRRTDHGAGGNAFLIGTPARGQMVGEWPGLNVLDEDDNLRSTADFRAVYCSLLEQWFGVDAAAVIPGASGLRPADADRMSRRIAVGAAAARRRSPPVPARRASRAPSRRRRGCSSPPASTA